MRQMKLSTALTRNQIQIKNDFNQIFPDIWRESKETKQLFIGKRGTKRKFCLQFEDCALATYVIPDNNSENIPENN